MREIERERERERKREREKERKFRVDGGGNAVMRSAVVRSRWEDCDFKITPASRSADEPIYPLIHSLTNSLTQSPTN